MPKKFIQRFLPHQDRVRNHPQLKRVFGKLLQDPNLLHLNRRSASGGFLIGLFFAFMPVPIQMLLAAGAAILFRVNLPLSVGLVWVTNPITIPPVFYFCYKLGAWILNTPVITEKFTMSWQWFSSIFLDIWEPLLLGSFICGLASALLGYGAIRLLWRLNVVRQWEARKRRRAKNRPNTNQMST
jgi:uncharacterized protein (DUF2062 family)